MLEAGMDGFMDNTTYKTLYEFSESKKAFDFAEAFTKPFVDIMKPVEGDPVFEDEAVLEEEVVDPVSSRKRSVNEEVEIIEENGSWSHIPTDFSNNNWIWLSTLAWWTALAAIAIREYLEPMLNFDESTIAAVASFGTIVDIVDEDLVYALGNTLNEAPTAAVLYLLYGSGMEDGALAGMYSADYAAYDA